MNEVRDRVDQSVAREISASAGAGHNVGQVCSRCIMDTSDPDIAFDSDGVCNHCHSYFRLVKGHTFSGDEGRRKLEQIVEKIKAAGKGRQYDCVLGVSGGVDSTYVAHIAHEHGLRPLAVHLDNGWNSQLAVHNIEKVMNKLGIDLYTEVLDWEEFKDLQISFLKSSAAIAEIPTDQAQKALSFRVAVKMGIKYVLSGHTLQTEAIMPKAWSYGTGDTKLIRSLQRQFGTRKLKTYPFMSGWMWYYYTYIRNIKSVRVLNYQDYIKDEAMRLIQEDLGWEYYGGKHYESIYTRFWQSYILPRKFGFDKRRAHLSNLVCAGQMTRDEALAEMLSDPYPEDLCQQDREYVITKLGFTEDEFEAIMNAPVKSYADYPNQEKLNQQLRKIKWAIFGKPPGAL